MPMMALMALSIPLGPDPYSLASQTAHKVLFVLDHVPPGARVTVVGHSVGCRMAIDLLEHFRKNEPERLADQMFRQRRVIRVTRNS